MKWWINRPWNDARPDLDGEMTPGPGCYRAAGSDADGTQDEYRAAADYPTSVPIWVRKGDAQGMEIARVMMGAHVTIADIDAQRAKGWPDFHPEDYCHRCGNRNMSWYTPSEVWNPVMRPDGPDAPWLWNEIICPPCFAQLSGGGTFRVEPDRAAPCGDPECPEEHGDEDAPVDTYSDYFHRSNFGDDVPLAPWGGPAPQPKLAARRGLARAWFVRAAILVLAVVLVLLLGWVR